MQRTIPSFLGCVVQITFKHMLNVEEIAHFEKITIFDPGTLIRSKLLTFVGLSHNHDQQLWLDCHIADSICTLQWDSFICLLPN